LELKDLKGTRRNTREFFLRKNFPERSSELQVRGVLISVKFVSHMKCGKIAPAKQF